MAIVTTAQLPSAFVTAIPGRFAPSFIVDRRNPTAITTDTTNSSRNTFLPRAESVSADFSTPTTVVDELGTNYNIGEFDSLPDSKVSISSYDIGLSNMSLITGKKIQAGSATQTLFQATDFQAAEVDQVIQYADPNGNVFYSEYLPDLLIEGWGSSLKKGSAAMESYDLVGGAYLGFRGFIITKAYVVQTADVTANSFTINMGTSEKAWPFPVPSGSNPQSYWVQRGCINYAKIERYRAATGWTRYVETSGSPQTNVSCTATGVGVFNFHAGDLVAGDLFFATYCSYGSNVTGYTAIPTTTIDTSDPIAVDSRLCGFTLNAGTVSGATGFDVKMSFKHDRVEGIGDPTALYGPPSQPEASISLDVNLRGANLDSLALTGNPFGTDGTGTSAGDFIDPNYETRIMLNTPTPIVAMINDPRNASHYLRKITSPNAVFKQRSVSVQTKSNVTLKYSGSDQVGNIQIEHTNP